MKEIVPEPPAAVRNQWQGIQALFEKHVLPTYRRFDLVLSHGAGRHLYDVRGKRYLDMGAGIAVCSLGHAHPELAAALADQAQRLWHISNLYYHESQGKLAQALVDRLGPGRCFFCNSGAEANEGLFKLARRFGHDEGRFEILTATNSFHGRTLAGIAATGQEKIKKGFEPMVPGFRQVPYNDLEAMRAALSPATVAILVEGVQGEGGITPASPDYLLGLRRLCDQHRLLLFVDGVQCGHYRTGQYQSYQRILESEPGAEEFTPDAVAIAKSLGGGFPMGAFWVREKHAELLGPGSHGTTYGGNPLGCAVALKILEVIEREHLDQNARKLGQHLKEQLSGLAERYPQLLSAVRGLGFMIGVELAPEIPALSSQGKSVALAFIHRLQEAGLLAIPAGSQVVRLLPPLNLQASEAEQAVEIIEKTLQALTS